MKGEQNVASAFAEFLPSIWLSNTIKSPIFFPQYVAINCEHNTTTTAAAAAAAKDTHFIFEFFFDCSQIAVAFVIILCTK
jgi:hypothetical protein